MPVCPECRQFVSRTASACPHCGRRMRMHPLFRLLLWVFLILPGAVILALVLAGLMTR